MMPRKQNAAAALFERHIAPDKLFAATLACFPAFLLQRNIAVLAVEIAGFLLLCLLRRGKIRLLPPLLIFVFVTVFNLVPPQGKVLWHVYSFALTEGALRQGIRKAEILVGMVFLSQFALSPRLALPGKAGVFLTRMFSSFDAIAAAPLLPRGSNPHRFSLNTVLAAIDERLCAASAAIPPASDAPQETAAVHHPTSAAGWVFLAALPLALYLALLV